MTEVEKKLEKIDVKLIEPPADVEHLWIGRKEKWNRTRITTLIVVLLAIGLSIFHFYTAGFGTLSSWHQRSIHVAWGLLLIFLLFPARKNKGFNWIDIITLVITLVVGYYILTGYPEVEARQGAPSNGDLVIGTMLILLVLEATRRTNGILMSGIAIFFLTYIFLGPYFPGALAHPGVSYGKVIDQMFNGTIGIFSEPIYVSSTVLILFVIFGAFLMRSGGGQFFTNFAFSALGSKPGGPALSGVGASALVGTITGNGAANAAITGAFTIPLMKKLGYKPKFAAAVEAVASQGGQIMPPIMGASVFIMAETTGIPYIYLALYALIPALIYFLIAGFIVYFHAKRLNLAGVPKEQLPDMKMVLLKESYLFLPIVAIIAFMLLGYSPMMAGFYAILMTIVLSWIRPATRMGVLDILACLEKGAKSALGVIAACATAGIIVGAVSITGLGLTFSRFVIDLAGENLLLLLVLTAVASIILGMGMPTVSAYVILAVLGVPALMKLGVDLVAAHMFVFYFGVMSGLTPPVAITAYTAAGIAGSNPTKTAFYSIRIGLGGFFIPFIFVYNPELLLQGGSSVLETTVAVITAIISCYAFAIAIENYWLTPLNLVSRLIMLFSALTLVFPGIITDIVGLTLMAIVYLSQRKLIVSQKQHFSA
jgi:TRAP transporter 4TM/12TM fusion protein